jgi:phosphinothricin acetyltransferase
MPLRNAQIGDLPRIVEIYNAVIPALQATADTTPAMVASREPWFREFDPERRPLWLLERDAVICGWLSLRSLYGQPAYQAPVEAAVYSAPEVRRTGVGAELLAPAIAAAPRLSIRTILAFGFNHNGSSLAPFRRFGFRDWGKLSRVAELDGVERDLLVLGLRTG